MDGMSLPQGGSQSRVPEILFRLGAYHSPCHTSSLTFPVPVRLLRKLFFTPVTHSDVQYFLYLDPVTRLYLLHPLPQFEAHTPTLSTLFTLINLGL